MNSACFRRLISRSALLNLRPSIACQSSPSASCDGSSKHTESALTWWLWVLVTEYISCFAVEPRRTQATAKRLLTDEPPEVLTTDRYAAYHWLHPHHRQVCWAHLLRDFRKMSHAQHKAAAFVGEELVEAASKLFEL